MINSEVRSGTLAGLTLSVVHLLPWDKLVETAVLAAIGASVSFVISRLLQFFIKKK